MAVRRGVAIVLTLITLAVIGSFLGVAFMYMLVSRGPSIADDSTLVLRPAGALQDTEPDDVVGQLIASETTTVRGFVESLRLAKRDPRITGVLLMPSSLDSPFWGKVQELRDAVLDFRKSGKVVVAFLEFGGDREYYLASAADKVYLLPTSALDLTGVASYEVFVRGTLDKLGAYPDFLQIGDYKTAVNQLTQKSFTPAHREMTESLNGDMYGQLVRGIASARKKTEAEMRQLLDQGPFAPEDAVKYGLVDGLAYEDQLDDRIPQLRQGGEMRRVDGGDYQRVTARSLGIRPSSRIAVLYASGVIASGRSGYDPGNGAVVGSDTFVEQVRRLREDDSIKAIVLRVDSPGGSSVASDVMWRELVITRDQKPSRPLITSMSDLAASGGYYISVPGQAIVAQPGTLTGSIGIFAGKIVIEGTLDKVGVTTETVKSGKNSDIYSPFARFSPEQRVKVGQYMDGFYKNFVTKVAQGRHMTPEGVNAIAQGRVWTGAQAKERGLVDALGGLDTAVAIAKQRAHIPADEDVDLVVYSPRRSFYEALTQLGRSSISLGSWGGLMNAGPAMRALATPVTAFRRGEPLALMPYAFIR
ncbi:MAG TPA: signal peptide peptidase SppA [Vicinamibacterales bacterium]|nr:signal peptide peptidase SppA [Vicinamibacterales bacterium]